MRGGATDAYIVAGPEASGNRYLTSILCARGCAGAGAHHQPFDDPSDWNRIVLPVERPQRVAFLRSLPHAGVWPDLPRIADQFRAASYSVHLLVPMRDQRIVALSQVAAGHVATVQAAHYGIRIAYRTAFASGIPYTPVLYSSLSRPEYVAWLLQQLKLPVGPYPEFVDGDRKYC